MFSWQIFDFLWLSFMTVHYGMFFLSTNITKIDMKNAKIGELERLELKIFFAS